MSKKDVPVTATLDENGRLLISVNLKDICEDSRDVVSSQCVSVVDHCGVTDILYWPEVRYVSYGKEVKKHTSSNFKFDTVTEALSEKELESL